MKNSVKILLAGAIFALSLGATASQATSLDVVLDSNGTPVITRNDDCLRSNWLSDTDACKGEEPAPAAPQVLTETKPIYFAFGRSSLTPAGKKALDAIAADITTRGAAVTSVRVAGFADRIGSATANEKLSKKRADRVRKYLVSKGVVNAQVVETRWFGDSVPSTTCDKGLSKAKLIKCLQPDRRVDVEIDMVPAQ
ncbi:MAG: OmpA family protein [Bdellovibrionales bacterium]